MNSKEINYNNRIDEKQKTVDKKRKVGLYLSEELNIALDYAALGHRMRKSEYVEYVLRNYLGLKRR